MVTGPKPRPPKCEDCGTEIDCEAILWDGHCPVYPSWGHTLGYEGICDFTNYLKEDEDDSLR